MVVAAQWILTAQSFWRCSQTYCLSFPVSVRLTCTERFITSRLSSYSPFSPLLPYPTPPFTSSFSHPLLASSSFLHSPPPLLSTLSNIPPSLLYSRPSSLALTQELFGGYDGVKVLVGCLKHDTAKFSSGLGHHRLLLAATDCVWCTVVGNNMVEDIFLENEGIFVLLDLLKVRVAE